MRKPKKCSRCKKELNGVCGTIHSCVGNKKNKKCGIVDWKIEFVDNKDGTTTAKIDPIYINKLIKKGLI